MSLIATVVLAGALQGAQAKTYRDDELGLIFQHPAAWTVKKSKYSMDFEFPVADGSKAVVQVFRTSFRQSKDTWQSLQKEVSAQMSRRTTRQWEETILGVPLLMSKIEYAEGAREMGILVGLLYTATVSKLNFRVNSTLGTSQEAEDAWRNVLLSLRTTSGELPRPEDPNRTDLTPTIGSGGQSITTIKPDGHSEGPVRTKNVVRIKELGSDFDVFLPEDWTLVESDGERNLQYAKLKGNVQVSFVAGGRQQLADALKRANEGYLDRFSVVTLRTDQPQTLARSGSLVTGTLRTGKDLKGTEAVEWHIVGTLGTLIWRVDYTTGSVATLEADRKAIERLRDLLAIEIAQ